MSTLRQEVILRGGQFILQEIRESEIGSQENILRKFADSRGQTIHKVSSFNGQPIHMFTSKANTVVFVCIRSLPFKDLFSLSGETGMTPNLCNWSQVDVPGAILMDQPFPLNPNECGFYSFFAVAFTPNSTTPGNAYLLHLKNGEFFKLPYPNIYDDGRICMGRSWENDKTGGFQTLLDITAHSYNSFLTTSLNADLAKTNTRMVFSKSTATGDWVIKPAEVGRYLTTTGSTWLTGFTHAP